MTIPTVLGGVAAADLGRTLMHEHVFSLYADLRAQEPWDEEAHVGRAVRRFRALRDRGFSTIVDHTVYGLGRSVPRVARIAADSGLQIVAATGIYSFRELPPYFRAGTRYLSSDFISDRFIRELTEGIGDTGVTAGVLKFATDEDGFSSEGELLLEQIARAQCATGVLVSTHSHAPSRGGLDQIERLIGLGVAPDRVVIGHSGDTTDVGYLRAVADTGATLGMDRFGHGATVALDDRIATVAHLCALGYADRMVLSHDTSIHTDSMPEAVRARPEWRAWDFLTIPDVVLPGLRAAGVEDTDVDTMTVGNPARLLEPGPPAQ